MSTTSRLQDAPERSDSPGVWVLGAATSGLSIARSLLDAGIPVLLSDRDPARLRAARALLPDAGLVCSAAGHDPEFARCASRLVLSPGIPLDDPAVRFADSLGRPIETAVEFVARRQTGEFIVVTGSSGKTTLVDVLRRLIRSILPEEAVFLSDRARDRTFARALAGPADRPIVAELSVRELRHVRSLAPSMLVVTSLFTHPGHAEFASFADYVDAKLGWIDAEAAPFPLVADEGVIALLCSHFARRPRALARMGFESAANRPPGRADPSEVTFSAGVAGPDPLSAVLKPARRILDRLGLGGSIDDGLIREAARATLRARCERIPGHSMPILDVGECKSPEALLWTARAVCRQPRVISTQPLPVHAGSSVPFLDLSHRPLALAEAIGALAGRCPGFDESAVETREAESADAPTIVIDRETRRRLFGTESRPRGGEHRA